MYNGKQDGRVTEHGLGYRVVHEMTQPFINKNRHVFYNSFFTSVKLAQDLEKDQTYLCVTVHSDRKDLPRESSHFKKEKAVFGSTKNVVCCVWRDTKTVFFLTTQSSPVGKDTVNRMQKDGSIKALPTITSTISYNNNMGGVDKSDHIHGYYMIGRKKQKVVCSRCKHCKCSYSRVRINKPP